ncbi:MAG: hypothetical protein ACRYG7_27660 [Janthinobacterium lividum]
MKNTYTTPADFWQERDFGAKISATFEFIGAHWRGLGRVLLYLVVPLALVQGIVAGALQLRVAEVMRQHTSSGSSFSFRYANYLSAFQSPWYFLNSLLGIVFQAVLILSVYGYLMRCVYAEQPGAPVTVPQVWAVVKNRLVGTSFSLLGIWVLIAFGFVCLFIPGVYLLVALSLFFVVSVLEDSSFVATISRCIDLVKGKWWSTFGLLFIMLLLIYLAFISFGVVAALAGGAKTLLISTSTLPMPLAVVISSLAGLLSVLFYVPLMLVLAFQYFNLIERREGLGMRLLLDKLGNDQAVATAQSSHYQPDEEGEY